MAEALPAPTLSTAQARLRDAARPGSRYDRWIGVLKRALPIAAGGLAASLVLFSATQVNELSFLLDKDQVDVASERLRVGNAVYRGEDRRGQPFAIRAGSAVQHSSRVPVVELNQLSAAIRLSDGEARIVAPQGRYDMAKETIAVEGPIRLRSDSGYSLDTRDVTVDLPTRTAQSAGAVDGSMPLGTFTAGGLEADVNARTVTLTDRARLHIVPGRSR
jgi:lipopolysaccharide export system protein LptC